MSTSEPAARTGLLPKTEPAFERFNACPISDAEMQAGVERVRKDVFESSAAKVAVPSEAEELVCTRIAPFYVRAECIAATRQRAYQRAAVLVYTLAPAAVAVVAIGSRFHDLERWAFLIEFALLLVIYGVVTTTDRRRARRHWIESRFLAERLRGAMFLVACGFRPAPSPGEAGSGADDEAWVVRAFDAIVAGLPPFDSRSEISCGPVAAFARKAWLEDQIDYHRKTASAARARGRSLEDMGFRVFALGLVVAAAHVVVAHVAHPAPGGWLAWFSEGLMLGALVLPAIGASLGGLRAHREYSRIAKRSASMIRRLEGLRTRYDTVDSADALRSALQETEELMRSETEDWLLLMGAVRLEAT